MNFFAGLQYKSKLIIKDAKLVKAPEF